MFRRISRSFGVEARAGIEMTTCLNEDTVEQAALGWFEELGYTALHGPDLAPGEPAEERAPAWSHCGTGDPTLGRG